MNNEEISKCYCTEVEAYLGATGYEGSNSHKHLYGSELSKAIRETLKKCGIKGVSISCKSFAGGQEIRAKVKLFEGDIRSWEDCKAEMIANKEENVCLYNWCVDPDTNEEVCRYNYFEWSAEKQKRAVEMWAKTSYERYINGDGFGTIMRTSQINKKECPCFSEKFFDRWNAIGKVINSFNYDRSNSQVDYFETNFYKDFEIIAA